MRRVLVDNRMVDLKECAYGFPWRYDATCYNFKAPDELILASEVGNIINPLDIEVLVIKCDLEDYSFISKMKNLRQLYVYCGENI